MLSFVQRNSGSNVVSDVVLAKAYSHHDIVDFSNINFSVFPKTLWQQETKARFSIFATDASAAILQKVKKGTNLIEFVDFSLGITPYDKYRGHSEEIIKSRGYHSATQKGKDWVPLISGANIQRFHIDATPVEYLRYGKWLGAPRERRFFIEPRIIVRQIASGNPPRIYAGFTEAELYHTQIGFSLLSKKKSKRELLQAVS